MSVLIFSWNTGSIPIHGAFTEDQAILMRRSTSEVLLSSVFSIFSSYLSLSLNAFDIPEGIKKISKSPFYEESDMREGYIIPDFFREMIGVIEKSEKPDIVIFAFQEDTKPYSSFHSTLLRYNMGTLGYKFFHRDKLIGLGVASAKTKTGRGLRTSYYIKEDKFQDFELVSTISGTNNFVKSKGYLITKVREISSGRIISFCNCHFPFNSLSLKEQRRKKDSASRFVSVENMNDFFVQIDTDVSTNDSELSFIFGDLNYRTAPKIGGDFVNGYDVAEKLLENREYIDELFSFDELKEQMRNFSPMNQYSEGIGGEGPKFLPSCKMVKGTKTKRDANGKRVQWNLGTEGQRIPSWCDRILYRGNIQCLSYDSFDSGNMKYSDHQGIYGLFNFSESG